MTNVLIINGHHKSFGSPGTLNASLTDRAQQFFEAKGYDIQKTIVEDGYEAADEVKKFVCADVVFFQTPINWMGLPWALKKYVDEVWMTGMMGQMSEGDGRTSAEPKRNYGLAPKLNGTYMLSVTGNAPKEAFNDPAEDFFAGMSEDDLLRPVHLNFKWVGLRQLPTFMAYDVMKNPDVEADFKRFSKHLRSSF